MQKYFKKTGNTDHISSWESKGLSDEIIKPPSNNSIAPELSYFINKIKVKFNGSCLKQDKITYTHGTIVNIYIVFKLSLNLKNFDLALEKCLFGAVKVTKNADIDKYKYSGYGIRFAARGTFLFPSGGLGQNVIISGADMSSSVHTNNKKKDILFLDEGITQGLEDTTLTAGKKYSINFTASRKKFCLSLNL